MATNTDALYQGLTLYRETLERQNLALQDEFNNLQKAWFALRQNYNGQGADEFAHAWGNTADWFEQFFEKIQEMNHFLEERTENLKQL